MLTIYGHIGTRQVPHLEQELLILPEHRNSAPVFVLFLLAIVMSVLQFTASKYPFSYLQTFLKQIRSRHGRVV